MSDTHLLRIERYDAGTFTDAAQKTQQDYLGVAGTGPDGRWSKAVLIGADAPRAETALRAACGQSNEMKGDHVVVCQGRWRVKGAEPGSGKGPDRTFLATSLEVVRGPAADLMVARLKAAQVLERADRLRRAAAAGDPARVVEDLLQAYQEMEGFLASFTRQPAPSRTPDMDMELGSDAALGEHADPEVAAKQRFEAIDAGRPVPAREDAAPRGTSDQAKDDAAEPRMAEGEEAIPTAGVVAVEATVEAARVEPAGTEAATERKPAPEAEEPGMAADVGEAAPTSEDAEPQDRDPEPDAAVEPAAAEVAPVPERDEEPVEPAPSPVDPEPPVQAAARPTRPLAPGRGRVGPRPTPRPAEPEADGPRM